DNWAYVRADLLIAMNATQGGPVQAILATGPLDPAVVASLRLTRLETLGAIGFVRGSIAEVQSSLMLLALVIAAVIGLLVYAAMSLEVHARAACRLAAPPSSCERRGPSHPDRRACLRGPAPLRAPAGDHVAHPRGAPGRAGSDPRGRRVSGNARKRGLLDQREPRAEYDPAWGGADREPGDPKPRDPPR